MHMPGACGGQEENAGRLELESQVAVSHCVEALQDQQVTSGYCREKAGKGWRKLWRWVGQVLAIMKGECQWE